MRIIYSFTVGHGQERWEKEFYKKLEALSEGQKDFLLPAERAVLPEKGATIGEYEESTGQYINFSVAEAIEYPSFGYAKVHLELKDTNTSETPEVIVKLLKKKWFTREEVDAWAKGRKQEFPTKP